MLNTNSNLDSQNPSHAFAHVESNEMPPDAIDHGPDPFHDAEAYHGTPGDGSGEDDLADLMAYGDEGCCDGPEDLCPDSYDDAPEDDWLESAYEDRFDGYE